MEKEIVDKIISIPLENWNGGFETELNGVKIQSCGQRPHGKNYLLVDEVRICNEATDKLYGDLDEKRRLKKELEEKEEKERKLKEIYKKLIKDTDSTIKINHRFFI